MRTSKFIKILFIIVLLFAFSLLSNKVYAKNLDEITKYDVKIVPNKKDGSLDITYRITWKVLDSTIEGPLKWVKIGMPNENFTNLQKVDGDIESISKYGSNYVRIDFKKSYKAGEEVTFAYGFHQTNMYTISDGKVEYTFWPAWFDSAEIKTLRIEWDGTGSIEDDSKVKDGNLLIWKQSNMKNGAVFKINVKYPTSYFSKINTSQEAQLNRSLIPTSKTKSHVNRFAISPFTVFIFFIVLTVSFYLMFSSSSRSYYSHSGFFEDSYYNRRHSRGYYESHYHHSSCACACASSCASSCACACAGSGRAGCSLKDFYGTNITTEKLEKAFIK